MHQYSSAKIIKLCFTIQRIKYDSSGCLIDLVCREKYVYKGPLKICHTPIKQRVY